MSLSGFSGENKFCSGFSYVFHLVRNLLVCKNYRCSKIARIVSVRCAFERNHTTVAWSTDIPIHMYMYMKLVESYVTKMFQLILFLLIACIFIRERILQTQYFHRRVKNRNSITAH